MSTKDTNPKDAVGTAKVPLSTVSAPVMAEVGLAMMEGARKYGRHNYRVSGVRASVYYDAVMRHLMSFYEGEDIDPDSGLPHIVKAIACLVVLRDSQIQGNWVDDRPPKTPDGWVARLNDAAALLLEKYPNALPAHTAADAKLADMEAEMDRLTYVDYVEDVKITVDSIDDADKDYVWESGNGRLRYNPRRAIWEFSSASNRLHIPGGGYVRHPGWIVASGMSKAGPLTRAQKVEETY